MNERYLMCPSVLLSCIILMNNDPSKYVRIAVARRAGEKTPPETHGPGQERGEITEPGRLQADEGDTPPSRNGDKIHQRGRR